MENIDINELKKLLVIIKDAPNVRVGHFSDKSTVLETILEEFCLLKDYEYTIYATNQEYANSVKESVKNVKFFRLERAKYMLNGKFFDYLFVTANIEDKEGFLKKAHAIIKNAGEIIIFVKNSNYEIIDLYRKILEENYYVATNIIKIDSDNGVIISKKMHGWGG